MLILNFMLQFLANFVQPTCLLARLINNSTILVTKQC